MRIGYLIANSLHYLPTIIPLIEKTGGVIFSFRRVSSSYLDLKNRIKIYHFRNYKHLLNKISGFNLDVLIHPSFSIRYFKNISDIKHVQVFHGTSDKPFNFHKSLKLYDLIVVPGEKMKEDIIKKGLAEEEKIKIIGYPKIDSFLHSDFDEDSFIKKLGLIPERKNVLYSPTWDDPNHYSSFPKFIKVILRELKDYNILVKPHPNIFKYRPWQIAMAYLYKHKNTFICNSNISILPFMKISDILLTDISSVSHEYLPFGKPMVFLSPKPVEKIPEEHRWIWHCGDVVENPKDLPKIVESNIHYKDKFYRDRVVALKKIFYKFDGKSADRFKEAIQKLIDGS